MKIAENINSILKYAAVIIVTILIILSLKQCSNIKDLAEENSQLKKDNQIAVGNLVVLKDTMLYWKDRTGQSISQISILTANEEMLKQNFAELYGKYNQVVGSDSKKTTMIAYLNTQITIRDRQIQELLLANSNRPGSKIINDSTILVSIAKTYDSANYYSVKGNVIATIKGDKIVAGKIDLTTELGLGMDLVINRDNKTGIAKITSKTAFPAIVKLGGITQIEKELNKPEPKSYIGLSVFGGYGMTLQKTPTLAPMLGIGVYYSPKWLTIKLRK